uniref:Uncharacterized protein n=1 Tax=Heterorhabditis bacteriophora TaxID=37862 RepID=A0A1I7WUE5_HETBA
MYFWINFRVQCYFYHEILRLHICIRTKCYQNEFSFKINIFKILDPESTSRIQLYQLVCKISIKGRIVRKMYNNNYNFFLN